MAEQFYTILTNTGRAKIANALPTGQKINLAKIKIGDSNGIYYNPSEKQTELVHKVYECNVTSVEVDENNPSWITITAAIPSDVGGFSIREVGVFDDSNSLIAIGKYPETYKPVASDGSTKELYIKMTLEVTNAASVELKIDPTVILATKSDIEKVNTKVEDITTQLNEKANKEEFENFVDFSWFTAPLEPAANKTRPNYFTDFWNLDSNKTLELYEKLRNDFPNYINRELLGKDASGIYDIYKYVFEPPTYEKTIILGSGIHGGEKGGVLGLYRFLYHVCNNYQKYRELSYMRWNVRIIVLPVQNPWGLSQSNGGVRYNSNKVDINRNFDYKWETFINSSSEPEDTWGNKGAAPFSENESKYIRDTLFQYNSAIAYVDFHSGGGTVGQHQVVLVDGEQSNCIFTAIANKYEEKGRITTLPTGDSHPSAFIYATKVLGIPACNPEWRQTSFSITGTTYDENEMKELLEFTTNIVNFYCNNNQFEIKNNLINGYYVWDGTGDSKILVSSQNYTEITESILKFKVPKNGLLKLSGTISFSNSDEASVNTFCPKVSQLTNDLGAYENYILSNKREVFAEGSKRNTIPFIHFVPVKKSDSTDKSIVKVSINAKTTTGTLNITRIVIYAELLDNTKYTFYKSTYTKEMQQITAQ